MTPLPIPGMIPPVVMAGVRIEAQDHRHPARNPHGPKYYAAWVERKHLQEAGKPVPAHLARRVEATKLNVVQWLQALYRGEVSPKVIHTYLGRVRLAQRKKAEATLLAALS